MLDYFEHKRIFSATHTRGKVHAGDPPEYHVVHLRQMGEVDCPHDDYPICHNGSWHLKWTTNPNLVTCEKCKERIGK